MIALFKRANVMCFTIINTFDKYGTHFSVYWLFNFSVRIEGAIMIFYIRFETLGDGKPEISRLYRLNHQKPYSYLRIIPITNKHIKHSLLHTKKNFFFKFKFEKNHRYHDIFWNNGIWHMIMVFIKWNLLPI